MALAGGKPASAATVARLSADLLAGGYSLCASVTGRSMSPTVRHGDKILVAPVGGRCWSPGDVAYTLCCGRIVVHRVLARFPEEPTEPVLLLGGDGNLHSYDLVPARHAIGRVVAVYRGGQPKRLDTPIRTCRGRVCAWTSYLWWAIVWRRLGP